MRKRKLTLIDNAKDVIRYAWSFRLAVLSAIFAIGSAALPKLVTMLDPSTYAILYAVFAGGTVLAASLAAFARVIKQPETLP